MLYLFQFFFLLEQCFVLMAFEHIIGSTNIWFKFCIKVTRVVGISKLGVDRYVFFRADTDTDYYRSSRPITDILNRYTCLV